MKRFLTLIVCAITLSAGAQIPYEFPYNPDADNDAFISTTDLVEFLALFGQDFTSEELYLDQDSTSAILYLGEKRKYECAAACIGLDGNWHVADWKSVSLHYDELVIDVGIDVAQYPDDHTSMWIANNPDPSLDPTSNLQARNRSLDYLWYDQSFVPIGPFNLWDMQNGSNEWSVECWCATQQRPRVEYSVVDSSTDTFNAILNSMAEEGWLLLPQGPFGNQITFWRWAD